MPSSSHRNSNSRATTRRRSARRKRPTNSNSPPSAIQRRRPPIRPNPNHPSHPNPTTMLTTIGRSRRRGRHSPAEQPLTRRTALRSHRLRRHRAATTAEHQSSPTAEDSSTDQHGAYPDRPLSHPPSCDPHVSCWYPKLILHRQVRSDLNPAISECASPLRLSTINPVGALDDGPGSPVCDVDRPARQRQEHLGSSVTAARRGGWSRPRRVRPRDRVRNIDKYH